MRGSLLVFILFSTTKFAYSQESQDEKLRMCILKASAYQVAAMLRDSDHTPQDALARSDDQIPLVERKKIINTVYFDARYEHAGGEALRMQMQDLCMNGPKNYTPLK